MFTSNHTVTVEKDKQKKPPKNNKKTTKQTKQTTNKQTNKQLKQTNKNQSPIKVFIGLLVLRLCINYTPNSFYFLIYLKQCQFYKF